MRLVRNVALAPRTTSRHVPAGTLNLIQCVGPIVRLAIDRAHGLGQHGYVQSPLDRVESRGFHAIVGGESDNYGFLHTFRPQRLFEVGRLLIPPDRIAFGEARVTVFALRFLARDFSVDR